MSTATKPTTEVQDIAVASIAEIPGFNPRGDFSRDDEKFLQLKASIAERGIETPIKVGAPDSTGMHAIIYGHRRFAAAEELGLEVVPAIVDAELDEKQRFLAAITENLIRAEMSPIAEARCLKMLREDFGMKATEAADAMQMSERTARNRQAMLELPESVQEMIEKGEVPKEASIYLAPIARVRPRAVEMIVSRTQGSKLADKNQVGIALEMVASDCGLQLIHEQEHEAVAPGSVAVDGPFRDKLRELWQNIPSPPPGWQKPRFYFDGEDAKQAKAAGALFEIEFDRWGNPRTARFITDPTLTFEMAKAKVPAMEKAARELIAKRGGAPDPEDLNDDAAAEREKERAKEEKARAKSNKELTDALAALANPKATDVDLVRLVVAMALGEDDTMPDLIGGGLGTLLPDSYGWPASESDDSDVYRGPDTAILQELASAKTSGECLRIFLRVVVASRFVNGGSTGSWWPLTGPELGDHPLSAPQMLDSVAERLGLVPAAAKKLVKERQKEAEKRAKEQAAAHAEAEAKRKIAEEEEAAAAAGDGEKADTRAGKALELIRETPGIAASVLAKEMGIKPNYLYRILGDLEKDGLITKDGRKYTAVENAEASAA